MFDFRRITSFCLEIRLSKHKMTICSKHWGGMVLLAAPWLRLCSEAVPLQIFLFFPYFFVPRKICFKQIFKKKSCPLKVYFSNPKPKTWLRACWLCASDCTYLTKPACCHWINLKHGLKSSRICVLCT